jgi:hypothetical protein
MIPRDQYSVVQFFINDTYEYVRRDVSVEEALRAVYHYTHNVAVKVGIIERVIITDGGDSIVFEWKKDKGITFPPEAVAAQEAKKP